MWYLNKIVDAVHARNADIIIHICGHMNSVEEYVAQLKSNAISTDAFVNLRLLKKNYSHITTMGNMSTFLLQDGEKNKIADRAQGLVREGINIISPACGLSTSTPVGNIQAMTKAVKESTT